MASKLRCINVIMDLRMALVVAVTSAIIAILMSKIIQEVTGMLQEGITTTYGMILEHWICGPKSPEETPNLVEQQKETQEPVMTTNVEADRLVKQEIKRDTEDGAKATAIERIKSIGRRQNRHMKMFREAVSGLREARRPGLREAGRPGNETIAAELGKLLKDLFVIYATGTRDWARCLVTIYPRRGPSAATTKTGCG